VPSLARSISFYSILKDEDNVATKSLHKFKIDYEVMRNELELSKSDPKAEFPGTPPDDDDLMIIWQYEQYKKASWTVNRKLPFWHNFGRDLTRAAEDGKLDPIVGREKEIERVSQILSRRKKNNPILIGEPGVGKSAIAEGLALRIVQRKVSRVLFGKRVVTLDLAS